MQGLEDDTPSRRGTDAGAPGQAAPGRVGRISVSCRVRPLLGSEVAKGVQRGPWTITDRSISLKQGAIGRAPSNDSRGRPASADGGREGHLSKTRCELRNVDHLRRGDGETIMDAVFGEEATTKEVYERSFKSIVANAAEGLNGAILAYGQTSSGKTYSISGSTAKAGSDDEGGETLHKGIIHFALDDLFSQIREQAATSAGDGKGVEFLVRMSYAELYMERVNDLLRKISPQTQNLPVKEDSETRSFYVEGLKEKIVSSAEEVVQILTQAEKRRRVAHTRYNEVSSRSHTILTLCVERSAPLEATPEEGGAAGPPGDEARLTQLGRLVIVDLAGNERMELGTEYMAESNAINTSLFFLGKVIEKLSAQARHARGEEAEAAGAHVPLRDSKLTRLLSVHLGGNSRTGILVTMTPAEDMIEQSLSTLRFAQKAGQVRCSAKAVLVSKEQSLIAKQREIIAQLKKQVQAMKAEAQGQQEQLHQLRPQQPPTGSQDEGDLAAERQQRAEEVQALTVRGPADQQSVVSRSREVDAIVTALHRNNDALRKQKATVLDEIKRMYGAITDAAKRAGRATSELKPGGSGHEAALEVLGGCPGPPAQGQGSAWAPALEELRSQMQSLVRLAYARGQMDEQTSAGGFIEATGGARGADGSADRKPDPPPSPSLGADGAALRQLREENSQLRNSVQFLAGERKRLKADAQRLQQAAREQQKDRELACKRSDGTDGAKSSPKSSADGKIGLASCSSGPAMEEVMEVEEPEVEKSVDWSDSWGEPSRTEASQRRPAARQSAGPAPPAVEASCEPAPEVAPTAAEARPPTAPPQQSRPSTGASSAQERPASSSAGAEGTPPAALDGLRPSSSAALSKPSTAGPGAREQRPTSGLDGAVAVAGTGLALPSKPSSAAWSAEGRRPETSGLDGASALDSALPSKPSTAACSAEERWPATSGFDRAVAVGPDSRLPSKPSTAAYSVDEFEALSGSLADFEPIVERAVVSQRLSASGCLGEFEPIVERNVPPTPPAPVRRPPSPQRTQDPAHRLSAASFRPAGSGAGVCGLRSAARSPMRLPTLADKLGELCLDRPGAPGRDPHPSGPAAFGGTQGVGRPPSGPGRSGSLPGRTASPLPLSLRASSPTLAPLREGAAGRPGSSSSRPAASRSPSRTYRSRQLLAS